MKDEGVIPILFLGSMKIMSKISRAEWANGVTQPTSQASRLSHNELSENIFHYMPYTLYKRLLEDLQSPLTQGLLCIACQQYIA